MKKETIIVPKGIRFMSEWDNFIIPNYPCIIDKKIPGCGFTEYCICNLENVILCSPRKFLLENKENQHPFDVFYVKNELDQDETTDKDLEKITRSSTKIPTSLIEITSEERRNQIIASLKNQINEYIELCRSNNRPIKILVTYDSFRLVKEAVGDLISEFRIIIDEFQSIFTDSRFKASTELGFLYHLRNLQKVCFVSATPMIDFYLEQLDEFKELPYYELDWSSDDPGRVLTPLITAKACRSINEPAYEIISKYLSGNFDSVSYRDDFGNIQVIYSKEAVFYVNSVSNILGIINKCKLSPEQCNILIARTPDNEKKLKKRLGSKWEIGRIPLYGEPHKMFTFCTRTVYLGADFYSTNAKTYIFSDANITTLSVDISLDLPQILGRQRNTSNPWKNTADFFYKTSKTIYLRDDFDKYVKEKIRKTNSLLKSHSEASEKRDLADVFKKNAETFNYRDEYVAVNTHLGNVLVPCFNKLVLLAEQRAFDIQQIDYKDRFSVFNTLKNTNFIRQGERINAFLEKFNSLTQFSHKLKLLCETEFLDNEIALVLDQIPVTYKSYYNVLGPLKCKALKYQKGELDKELSIRTFNVSDLKKEIQKRFSIGEIYPRKDIKTILESLYIEHGYIKTPKATDLLEFFEVQECKKQINGKRDECFKIIRKLS